MKKRRKKRSGRATNSTATIATPPHNGFGTLIICGGWLDVKLRWTNVIDQCLDVESELDARISRLMVLRQRVMGARREAERIVFGIEDGGLS